MIKILKKSVTLLAISVLSLSVYSQKNVPIDTIIRGNLKVVLYEDKTWDYIEFQTSANEYTIDTVALFSEYWNTNVVLPRKPDYARTKDTCVINFKQGSGNYVFPRMGKLISPFGIRKGRMHTGIDIQLDLGDTIVAAFDGIVRYAGWNNSGYGNTVIIRHYNGLETLYAHLSAINCSVNQRIKAGELVGLGGATGRASGNHLHFETLLKDNAFNPELIFKVSTGELVADEIPIYPENFNYLKNTSNSDYHVVKKGDTLYAISLKYKVSVNQICKLNGITEKSILSLGQRLRLR